MGRMMRSEPGGARRVIGEILDGGPTSAAQPPAGPKFRLYFCINIKYISVEEEWRGSERHDCTTSDDIITLSATPRSYKQHTASHPLPSD